MQPEQLTVAVEISNIVFSAIFAVEMLLKIIAEGPFGYISNGFNVFDGVVVVLRYDNLSSPFIFSLIYIHGTMLNIRTGAYYVITVFAQTASNERYRNINIYVVKCICTIVARMSARSLSFIVASAFYEKTVTDSYIAPS